MKVLRKVLRRVRARIAARPTLVRLPTGAHIFVTPSMRWAFKSNRYYELNVEHWLVSICKLTESCVFYDVGANLGYYSALLSANTKQVVSFEPSSNTRRILKFNVKISNSKNVSVLPFGLSDHSGDATLNIYSTHGNNSLFDRKIPLGHSLKLRGTQTVRLATLDGLVDEFKLDPPDLIKIDIEGGELAALTGAKATIDSARPVILFEYSDTTSNDAGYQRTQLTDFLAPFGYTFYGLSTEPSDLRPYSLTQSDIPQVDNVIAIPEHASALVQRLAGY